MKEIEWKDRLASTNHVPYFPFLVTGIVDTFSVTVLKPMNNTLCHALYNPKYSATVYKVFKIMVYNKNV